MNENRTPMSWLPLSPLKIESADEIFNFSPLSPFKDEGQNNVFELSPFIHL
jgi:hypothetical protein